MVALPHELHEGGHKMNTRTTLACNALLQALHFELP
jgi:hypothetical protein